LLFTVTSTVGFTPTPLEQSGLKLVCKVNIQYGKLKSENSQVSPEPSTKLYVDEFGFCTYSKLHSTSVKFQKSQTCPINMQYCNLMFRKSMRNSWRNLSKKLETLKWAILSIALYSWEQSTGTRTFA
jgi:hypothetical protein